jgi:hypothetical protein
VRVGERLFVSQHEDVAVAHGHAAGTPNDTELEKLKKCEEINSAVLMRGLRLQAAETSGPIGRGT